MTIKLSIIFFLVSMQQNMQSQDLYKFNLNNFREQKVFNQPIEKDNFQAEILNAAIFWITNEIRLSNNLKVVSYCNALEKSATMQSTDMANSDFFAHTNPTNKKHREPEDRAKKAGIKNPFIAENIIEGFLLQYTSGDDVLYGEKGEFFHAENNVRLLPHTYLSLADDLMKQWMQSPGHRANILSEKALQLGCGTALYIRSDFNDMPAAKATQNFQWFEFVQL